MAEMHFKSFGELARFARGINMLTNVVLTESVRLGAEIIHAELTPMFGHYQSGEGSFPAWAPLQQSTQDDRAARGYAPNEPLLVTGELRDSYKVESGPLWAGVGSELEKAVVQEFGDPRHNTPARSTLGIAFVRSEKKAFAAFAAPIAGLYTRGKRGARVRVPV